MKKTFKILAVITLVVFTIVLMSDMKLPIDSSVKVVNNKATSTQKIKPDEHEEDIEAIMERPEFEKEMRLQAEKIYWQEQKDEIKTKYEKNIEEVEANLEKLRSEEVSL